MLKKALAALALGYCEVLCAAVQASESAASESLPTDAGGADGRFVSLVFDKASIFKEKKNEEDAMTGSSMPKKDGKAEKAVDKEETADKLKGLTVKLALKLTVQDKTSKFDQRTVGEIFDNALNTYHNVCAEIKLLSPKENPEKLQTVLMKLSSEEAQINEQYLSKAEFRNTPTAMFDLCLSGSRLSEFIDGLRSNRDGKVAVCILNLPIIWESASGHLETKAGSVYSNPILVKDLLSQTTLEEEEEQGIFSRYWYAWVILSIVVVAGVFGVIIYLSSSKHE